MAHGKARRKAARQKDGAQGPLVAQIGAPPSAEPNHHLWKNGRLWWVAFTVHRGHLQERVRVSLHTSDIIEARHRRGALFGSVEGAGGCTISLRFGGPPRRVPNSGAA